MKKTGFLYDERYQLHTTGNYHPEVPDRLSRVYEGIKQAGLLPKLVLINASRADMKWIEMVHDRDYIQRFEAACSSGVNMFDSPDNQMCSATYETALLAVGGIVDFDVHHGNGTQHIFEGDPTVFYYSIHQHPSFAYPGTGREFESGKDFGHGYTKNSPVLPGHGDEEYKRLIKRDLFPAFEEFKPQAMLVSTGFDAHREDEMSDIKLSTEGFSWIMQNLVELADRYSDGKIISILEGGYSLRRLPELAANHVEILLK